jgi:hypothetical protein
MQEDINRDNPAKPENTAAEDKYVEDYPINESGTEPSKPDNSKTIEVRASKRVKKPPEKKSDFFMVKEKCTADKSPLQVFHQNICGLRGKSG